MFHMNDSALELQWWVSDWLHITLRRRCGTYIMHEAADTVPHVLIKTLIKRQWWQPLMTEAWTWLLISHSTLHSSANAGCQPRSQTWADLPNRTWLRSASGAGSSRHVRLRGKQIKSPKSQYWSSSKPGVSRKESPSPIQQILLLS